MIKNLRQLTRHLPSLLVAFLLALAVWVLAVTSTDPVEVRNYPKSVPVEVIGQAPNLIITSTIPEQVTLTLRAPSSTWTTLATEKTPVRVFADLSGLEAGQHDVELKVQISVRPVGIVTYSPHSFSVTLEPLEVKEFPIELVTRGDLAVGYQAGTPLLSQETATISGPASLVGQVEKVRAILDISQVRESISRAVTLTAVDSANSTIQGLTIAPEKVTVTQSISQRGGYRNVVVKVVSSGQIASGYRLTSISVFPPTVTVYSSNPQLVDDLPGYIETEPLSLSGKKDDFDAKLKLLPPSGVEVVDSSEVAVQVNIAAIESSLALSNVIVESSGLSPSLAALISPVRVDIIVAGPLPVLDTLILSDVRVLIDLTGYTAGTYTIQPEVTLNIPELRVESILPTEFVIRIYPANQPPPKP